MCAEKMYGYNGKIAYIDLNSADIKVKKLDPKITEEYIGGVGLSAKISYDFLTDKDYEELKHDPFFEKNPLIFATGPLTGSVTPSSSRYSVTAISPLTGIWGESTSGGFFPITLRKCGFDCIIITGKAEEPKYVLINNGNIEIKPAKNIWNKNTQETIQLIKKELNNEQYRVACIGKAGENLIKYAAIINDEGRAAGRCGLGAIMGSKMLKAIAVNSFNSIEYMDKNSMLKQSKTDLKNIKNAFAPQFLHNHGTLNYMDLGMIQGDVPAYYYTESEFTADILTGFALKEKYPVISYACAGCVIGCGRMTYAEIDGEEIKIDGPEYETTAAFGPMCGIFDFDPIIKANHICNLNGIDTISAGVSISFLIYLVENGIGLDQISLYLEEIKMNEIEWGNDKIVLKILHKIVNREGIGNVLAEGTRKMAEILNVSPDLAAHVKGLEVPMHEPRAYCGQALSYMTCCVGANHCKGDFYLVEGGFTMYRKVKKGERFNIEGRESAVINLQDIANIYDSSVVCLFPKLNENSLANFLEGSTGFKSLGSVKKLLKAGERGNNIKRLISCKLGLTREDDYLKKINTQPLNRGITAGVSINLEKSLKKYYDIRGWDWKTGWPTEEKLNELNI